MIKKVLYLSVLVSFLVSCGGNTQKQEEQSDGTKKDTVKEAPTAIEMLSIDQVYDLCSNQTITSEDDDILSMVTAFNKVMPTYCVTTFLKDVEQPEDLREYLDEVDKDNGFVSFAEGSDDKDSESMEARAWKRNNGHKLLAIAFSQPSSEVQSFAAFYDYDPATQTLSPEYDYLKYFKTSFSNSMFGIILPQDNNDIVINEYFMNWGNTIRHTYIWDGNSPSQCVTTIENMDQMEAMYNEVSESDLEHPFTQYALIDIDNDGEPELLLSDDKEENQAVFSIVQENITLLAAADYKRHLMFYDGVVGDAGGCGTGCFYSKYSIVEESGLKSTFMDMQTYNMETEDMDSEFELDGDIISEDKGQELLNSFGELVEPTPDWRPMRH